MRTISTLTLMFGGFAIVATICAWIASGLDTTSPEGAPVTFTNALAFTVGVLAVPAVAMFGIVSHQKFPNAKDPNQSSHTTTVFTLMCAGGTALIGRLFELESWSTVALLIALFIAYPTVFDFFIRLWNRNRNSEDA